MNWLKFCLEDDHLLIINTPLAEAIGLNEAIFVRQLHYWLSKREAIQIDGHWWVYASHQSWRDRNFRFWSTRTVRRIIDDLIKEGIVLQRRRKDSNGSEIAPLYSLDNTKLDTVLKDFFDKNPDAVRFYFPSENTSDGVNKVDRGGGQSGQGEAQKGVDKVDRGGGQSGHQRDSVKKNPKKLKENPKDTNGASRKLFFASLNKEQSFYVDGKPVDPASFQPEYNALFYAALDAMNESGFALPLDFQEEWNRQRDGAVALARARISVEDLKAYVLTDVLARDANGKNWHLENAKRPLLSTIANRISTWLKEREKQNAPETHESADYVPSENWLIRKALNMKFASDEDVIARLQSLGLGEHASLNEVETALKQNHIGE